MGEEGGSQFNGVARIEARFAEELGGQFERGNVPCVHVDAGEADDARGPAHPTQAAIHGFQIVQPEVMLEP